MCTQDPASLVYLGAMKASVDGWLTQLEVLEVDKLVKCCGSMVEHGQSIQTSVSQKLGIQEAFLAKHLAMGPKKTLKTFSNPIGKRKHRLKPVVPVWVGIFLTHFAI